MVNLEGFTARVDEQGRILIPARLRQRAGIAANARVLVFFEDGALVVATPEAALAQARRLAQEGLKGGKGALVRDLMEERRRETEGEGKERERTRKSA